MASLSRDGVALAYEEAGSGGPPLLLVHGFGGNRTNFAALLDYFRARHRTVAVDRRGHGDSDKPQAPYSIELFSDDLAWLCEQLGIHRPVVVVHSQDVIAFDLAARYPELASGIVIIDGPTFRPPELNAAFEGLLPALRGPDYQEAIRHLVDQAVCLPTDEPEIRAEILDGILSVPQHVLAATWEAFLTYDLESAAARSTSPLLFIRSHFPADVERLRMVCPHALVGQTVGAGHFSPLIIPGQVSAMIDRFMKVAVLGQPAAAAA